MSMIAMLTFAAVTAACAWTLWTTLRDSRERIVALLFDGPIPSSHLPDTVARRDTRRAVRVRSAFPILLARRAAA